MYNTDIPTRAELPTSRQLIRSTIIAILSATVILVVIVLPAEYAIDPTGIGRMLRLTEMGEIKAQLSEEAARDRARGPQGGAPDTSRTQEHQTQEQRSSLLGRIFAQLVIGPAAAQTAPARRTDELSLSLKPGEGIEVKLVMRKGATADFSWAVSGGVVNFDQHGDGGGQSISYKKGRAVPGKNGVLEAAFAGNHGWYWRNRGSSNVTILLRTNGTYTEIKQMP